jgi:ribose 5-phosphate isomerase B
MIIIGSDHTGIELKNNIINYLKSKDIEVIDATNYENQSGDDYPDRAYEICKKVLNNPGSLGIAICGTGIGISIACNKVVGIRASVCTDKYMAKMTRQDNDANVLCLGARLELENVYEIVDEFINTEFAGGRHQRRVDKITQIEKCEKEGVAYGGSL